jgi:caffeoyl-CoA O-methyltransferase
MDFLPQAIEDYCRTHSQPEPEIYQRLAEETRTTQELPQMLSGPLVGNFLQLLVRLLPARRVLEIGTFTGYSALKMAEALPEDGELLTCEINPETAAVAQRYFDEAPWGSRIRLLQGPARKSLKKLTPPFDLVFIDADKQNYPVYYREAVPLVRAGGILVLDNMLWSGRVLEPEDDASRALAATNELIHQDPRVFNQLLPIRDGLMVAVVQ